MKSRVFSPENQTNLATTIPFSDAEMKDAMFLKHIRIYIQLHFWGRRLFTNIWWKTRREIVMQDTRGTFQSESFYKMITIAMIITFLLSLNERYLWTRYCVPCICGLEDSSIIRRHIFVNKSIPEQTKVCLVHALGR